MRSINIQSGAKIRYFFCKAIFGKRFLFWPVLVIKVTKVSASFGQRSLILTADCTVFQNFDFELILSFTQGEQMSNINGTKNRSKITQVLC